MGIAADPLSVDTEQAVFAVGRRDDFEPWGGVTAVAASIPRAAALTLRAIPEGDFHVAFAGYALRAFAAPNPSSFPALAYCLRDVGDAGLRLVSGGGRSPAVVVAEATALECAHTGVDRFAVDADYDPDPFHPFFGSAAGTNVAVVYLDDWGTGAALSADLGTDAGTPPFGLFAELPDTSGGGSWPDPAVWNESLSLVADGNGDARFYLVVRPDALPVLHEARVVHVASNDAARVRIWVEPAVGGPVCVPPDCDDDNACTTDDCDPIAGCVHTSLPDGTACGTGWVCEAGACVPGTVLLPMGSLTGDCANDGTATTSFAQMRCGNGLILGNPPLEVQRYAALSFDLSALPAGLQIASAHVHVFEEQVYGDGPFTPGALERVVAEHVSYTTLYGGCDLWNPIAATIGQVLVSDSAAPGWRSSDITEAVRYGLAASPRRVQLRLRFVPQEGDGDGADDLVAFASDNTTTPGRVPFLVVHTAP